MEDVKGRGKTPQHISNETLADLHYLGSFTNRFTTNSYSPDLLAKYHAYRTQSHISSLNTSTLSKKQFRPMQSNMKQYMISSSKELVDCLAFISTSTAYVQQFLLRFEKHEDAKVRHLSELPIFTQAAQQVNEESDTPQTAHMSPESRAADSSSQDSSSDEMYQDVITKKQQAINKKKQIQANLPDLYAKDCLAFNCSTGFYNFIVVEAMGRSQAMQELLDWRTVVCKMLAAQCVQKRQELMTVWFLRKLQSNQLYRTYQMVPSLKHFLNVSGMRLKTIQNDIQRQQFYNKIRRQKVDYYLDKTNKMCRKISEKINLYKDMPVPYLLDSSEGQLRPYQVYGMKYLLACTELNYNCLLADDLGLGKSLQTIALLTQLAVQNIHGPHLIVVPSTLIYNWEQEFKKWAPFINLVVYYGTKAEREKLRSGWSYESHSSVVLTSYNVAVIDYSYLKRKNFYYLVLDEAHIIRNNKSKAWNTLMDIKSQHKLLVSGTPISNTSSDIWSLLHFVLPGIFSSKQEFLNLFSRDIEKMADGELAVNRKVIKWIH